MARRGKLLVIGGAGFIGAHVAKRWITDGCKAVVVDNLSRKGSESNLKWLKSFGEVEFCKADITDFKAIQKVVNRHKDVECVAHMAAQVAVTTSVSDPRKDFEINALGTFNLLESLRLKNIKPLVIYASTNKVYGEIELPLRSSKTRYYFSNNFPGISEDTQLNFHSPYGCSKGAADQYVRDYCRIYGIPTVVFRQSCIYGARQFGVEDQGWMAHFVISAALGQPITIYGDGKQVRDVLYIDDLVDLFVAANARRTAVRGRIYNIGGGTVFTLSLIELLSLLEKKLCKRISVRRGPWRPGDQKIYISDVRKIKKDLGWKPTTDPESGIGNLVEWVSSNIGLFK